MQTKPVFKLGAIFRSNRDNRCQCHAAAAALGVTDVVQTSEDCVFYQGDTVRYVEIHKKGKYLLDITCIEYFEREFEDAVAMTKKMIEEAIADEAEELHMARTEGVRGEMILESLKGKKISIFEAVERLAVAENICFYSAHQKCLIALGVEQGLFPKEPKSGSDNQGELTELLCADVRNTYIS